MPQLNLNFTDIPIPQSHLWEQLDEDEKQIVIETLAPHHQSSPSQQLEGADQ